jgi:hypothetical protein
MTILNNDLLGNYVAITPVTVVFIDIVQANCLVASIVNDNLTSACVVQYTLYNLSTGPSGNTAQQMYTNTLTISGTAYTAWTGDNTYVYTYISSQIPITIL